MTDNELEIRDKTIFDGFVTRYVFKLIYCVCFKLAGWRKSPSIPEGAGITIAAPHTSNWDFVFALGAALLSNVKIYFSIKENWCRKPLIGRFVMWLGAIPIDRSSGAQGQVDKIRNFVLAHREQRIFFLFTPEGTRRKVERWKTGFYHVAQGSGLPIFLAKVDYLNKEAGVFHTFHLTGDKDEDIQAIQESYKGICGRVPANQYPGYVGPFPEISDSEAAVMQAVYSFKGVATRMEIAARLRLDELSFSMLDYLVKKGILEHVPGFFGGTAEPAYRLTFTGKGCLLHLYPILS
jgi:1-acyl-sn-glycerol-3-phosphate acyltransferase